MRKLKYFVLLILLFAFALAPSGAAIAAVPGSAADPLVSKSWVDKYVEEKFASLQEQLNEIQAKLAPAKVDISLYIGKNTATVNGVSRYIDPERPAVAPKLLSDSNSGGYTMVPIRFIDESLGITVEWLSSTNQVMFTDGSKRVLLTAGTKDAAINGVAKTMGYASFIENQRTYVHIRFVAEAFDCKVDWSQVDKKVTVTRGV